MMSVIHETAAPSAPAPEPRFALMEITLVNGGMPNLIATGAPVNELRRNAEKDGFRTLYQEGLAQVISGSTSFDEISCLSYTSMG
jgi:type II secretory ATPase GspE/PulE/Tfp pilus assembly ATPase PilB-like protein